MVRGAVRGVVNAGGVSAIRSVGGGAILLAVLHLGGRVGVGRCGLTGTLLATLKHTHTCTYTHTIHQTPGRVNSFVFQYCRVKMPFF